MLGKNNHNNVYLLKTADIGFKTSQIPREYEHDLRKNLINRLQRGNIDLFIAVDQEVADLDNIFNVELIKQYYKELQAIFRDIAQEVSPSELAVSLLRLPEVREVQKKEVDIAEWQVLEQCIYQAADKLDEFRCREGEIDKTRVEQELIYYLEKADISEERVRLSQHCTYFRQTIVQEEYAGRKLNFIAQEMGREINTLGSKAAHAGMQQYVVMMKDELEKIKEQVLNVL